MPADSTWSESNIFSGNKIGGVIKPNLVQGTNSNYIVWNVLKKLNKYGGDPSSSTSLVDAGYYNPFTSRYYSSNTGHVYVFNGKGDTYSC
jgi:hypothetical protein